MHVIITLSVERHLGGFIQRTAQEHLVQPEDVTVLNEHGDITIGHGRKAMTYMGREVQSVTYVQ